jgi:uncharacterized protein (TIRG00374 family)
LAIGLLISLLALWLAFRGADVAEVARALREANYWLIFPAVLFIWLGLVMRALSWRVILGGQVPFRRVYHAINEGYLLNNLLPFRLGEFGRAYLVSRGGRLSVAQALSSVVVERVIDLLMVLVLLAAFLPLLAGLEAARNVAALTAIAGLAALAALVLVARYRAGLLRLLDALLKRLPFRRLHPERWTARVGSFLDGLAVLQDPGRAARAAFWSGGAWVVSGLAAWLLLVAFVPTAPVSHGFFVLAVLGLGVAVPSAPGQAGVFEFVIVQTLAVLGIAGSVALSFAITFHILHIGLTTALGGWALSREGETLGHLVRMAQSVVTGAFRADSGRDGPPGQDATGPADGQPEPGLDPARWETRSTPSPAAD